MECCLEMSLSLLNICISINLSSSKAFILDLFLFIFVCFIDEMRLFWKHLTIAFRVGQYACEYFCAYCHSIVPISCIRSPTRFYVWIFILVFYHLGRLYAQCACSLSFETFLAFGHANEFHRFLSFSWLVSRRACPSFCIITILGLLSLSSTWTKSASSRFTHNFLSFGFHLFRGHFLGFIIF